MIEKHEILNPIEQIQSVRELFLFTLYLQDMLVKKEIDISKFNTRLSIVDGKDENTVVICGQWKDDDLTKHAINLSLCTLGNCFVTIDKALDTIFGRKPEEYSNSDIDALRAIIYMLRCAIAHSPTIPEWRAKPKYRRKFKINDINFEMDFDLLNGKNVNHSHYKGLGGVLLLIDYSLEAAKRYYNE